MFILTGWSWPGTCIFLPLPFTTGPGGGRQGSVCPGCLCTRVKALSLYPFHTQSFKNLFPLEMELNHLVITHKYLGFSNGEIRPCRLWLGSYNRVFTPLGLPLLLSEP